MKLHISNLEKIIMTSVINDDTKETLSIFISAANDWPNPVLSLEDYELEVENFVKGETKKSIIKATLDKIDFSKDAWIAESLSQVLEVFKFFENDLSLKEIIKNLQIKLKEMSSI